MGSVARGAQHDSGVTEMKFLVISGAYVFGIFRAKANVTIQRYEVLYRLSNDPKMIDLERL